MLVRAGHRWERAGKGPLDHTDHSRNTDCAIYTLSVLQEVTRSGIKSSGRRIMVLGMGWWGWDWRCWAPDLDTYLVESHGQHILS